MAVLRRVRRLGNRGAALKVYCYPADLYGCGHYRLIYPALTLAEPDVEIEIVKPGDRTYIAAMCDRQGNVNGAICPPDADVLVLQRPAFPQLAAAIPYFRAKGVAVVVDVDDDLAHIDPANPAWLAMHPDMGFKREQYALRSEAEGRREEAAKLRAGRLHPGGHSWRAVSEACRDATLVTVSTEALANVYGRDRAVVLPNYVPAAFLGVPRVDSDVVGWPGSTHSHPGDLRAMTLPPEARFFVVGTADGADREVGRKVVESTGPVEFGKWASAVAQIGVGVAPLADTRFNRGKCIDAPTRIASSRGFVPIGELVPGDEVWQGGAWVTVEATARQDATEGVRITTTDGYSIAVTPNHRLWANGRWMFAGELRAGDVVSRQPENVPDGEFLAFSYPGETRHSHRRLHSDMDFVYAEDGPRVALTERWGRLLGIFAGDGSVGANSIMIHCDGIDADLIDPLIDDFQACGFGATTEPVKTFDGTVLRVRSVRTANTNLIRFLRSLGVVDLKENGRPIRRVCIPDCIWRSPRRVIAAFLSGLFEADGSAGRSGVVFAAKSHRFAQDVQRLLGAFGIECALRRHPARYQDGVSEATTLRIRRAGCVVFEKEIGFISERKQQRLATLTAPKSPGHAVRFSWEDATEMRRRRASGEQLRSIASAFGTSPGYVKSIVHWQVWKAPFASTGRPQQWTSEVVTVEPVTVDPVDIQVEGGMFAAAGWVSHNSWLKSLEMAAVGVPWVASPTPEYRRLHELGCGALARKPKEWLRELRRLIADPALRQERSETGRQVAAGLTVEGHAWRWAEQWRLALDLQRGARRASVNV